MVLNALGISPHRTLERLSDLANLFLAIAHELDKADRDDLFKQAVEVALMIAPDLLRKRWVAAQV